jgi:hypothetical protein
LLLNIKGKGKVKIINKTTVLLFLVVVVLTSCNHPISAPRTRPTEAMETALSSVRTEIVETQQAAIPTATATVPSPTAIPERKMQVYTDPEGRYTITFPADWKTTDKPNSFSGKDGFFETGYMPDMGYVTSNLTVLTWLANIESKPEQSDISWMEESVVLTKSSSGNNINYVIHETPRADPAHRFIYVKTGKYPTAYVYDNGGGVSFSWLKFAYEEKPKPGAIPLSPEEFDFWKNAIPMPSNISITEYALPPEKNPNENDGLFQFVPTQAWVVGKVGTSPAPHKTTLKEIGYETKNFQLYRDGRLLFDNVTHVSDIYRYQTDSGPITAFIVEIELGNKNYVIQNDAINAFGEYAEYTSAPVLYKGELLWARKQSGIVVQKNNRKVVFYFKVPSLPNHYPRFRA